MNVLWEEIGEFKKTGQEEGESLWIQKDKDNNKVKLKGKLEERIETEVLVIGAGLAGVLTAYHLQEKGIPVVVLDINKAGRGITKNTTAKISSQHGLIYNKLLLYSGKEKARLYAKSNENAIKRYGEIIRELNIDCDFEVLPSYVYSINKEAKIQKEVDAAKKLGIAASFTKETSLPFKVKGAVRFENQAQFHPIKFLDALADKLTIYENTRVTKIYDNGLIETDKGSVKARKVVIATHYPFINVPGYYFLKLHQEREYLSALKWPANTAMPQLDGMYLDENKHGYTFRNHKDFMIFGGGYHRTGKYQPLDAYVKLENAAKRWFPESEVAYAWSNQDCMTPDSIPYIGQYSSKTPNIFVATGFNKWGMTGSMVAANILKDLIMGRENPYEKVYKPRRLMLSGGKVFVKDTAIITISLLAERLKISHDRLEQIKKEGAGVVKHKGQRVGVYRDKEDKYYYVSTKCPHLGCKLEWNQNEKTWDCPCHGSRFDYKGRVINNPASRDLFDVCMRKK